MSLSDQSALDFISQKWSDLCRSVRFGRADAEEPSAEIRDFLAPLNGVSLRGIRDTPSYIADDGFPVEASISWSPPSPEVRLMFESVGSGGDLRAVQDAGRALTRELASRPGVSLDRYLAIEELFLSALPASGQATIWHAIARRQNTPTRYKIYLNPRVYGVDRAAEVVAEAMGRMGLAASWQTIAHRQAELARRGHKIEFLALDLDRSDSARVKVYYRHEDIPFDELDTVARLAPSHDSSRAVEAYRSCYGERDVIVNAPMTCLAFTGAGGPEQANVYLRLDKIRGEESAREVMRREGIMRMPVVPGAEPEFLSFRTRTRSSRADVGLYMRFPLSRQTVRGGGLASPHRLSLAGA